MPGKPPGLGHSLSDVKLEPLNGFRFHGQLVPGKWRGELPSPADLLPFLSWLPFGLSKVPGSPQT